MKHGDTRTRKSPLGRQALGLLALGLGAAFAQPALAQEGRSRAVGYLTQTIPAGQTRSFSVPFDADTSTQASSVGKLTAVGANYLEHSGASWTPGAFSNVNAPYFVRITSGAHTGRTFRISATANTATRIYVTDDGLGLAALNLATGADGTRFEIIPADTLGSFFGTGGELVVQGATSAAGADLVQVWGGAAWLNFYYNSTWQRWARDTDLASDPSRNSYVLRSDRGLMITRRGSTDLDLLVVGRVLNTPQRAFHTRTDSALTFLATMQASDATLGALALQSATRSLNWKVAATAADAGQADLLIVWSNTSWLSFFYNSSAGHWQRVGDAETANRDGYTIAAGTPVFVQRRGTGTSAADKTVIFPTPGS